MPWKTFIYCLSLVFILVSCGQDPIILPEGPVALLVRPPDVLTLSNPSTTLNLSNLGTTKSSWKLSVRQDKDNAANEWFSLSSRSGVLDAGQNADVTLTLQDSLSAGVYKATLVFTYQKKSHLYQVIGLIDTGSFRLELSNSDVLSSAKPLSIPIAIKPEGSFDDEVTLSLAGLPTGINGTFTPNPATTQSTLELSTDGNTAPGNYTLAILGNSPSIFAKTNLSVLVASNNTQSGFSLALEEPVLELATNQTISTNLFIRRSNGLDTPVTLSADNIPAGLTVTLDPNPVASQTALTIQAASSLATSNYPITLKGLADTLESNVTLQVRITANQSASLSGTIITDNARVSTAVSVNNSIPIPAKAQFAAGQLLVKYKEIPIGDLSTQVENRQSLSLAMTRDYGVSVLRTGLPGQHDLIQTTQDVLALANQLEQDPRIEYAEPNYLLEALELPNDPKLNEQWFLAVAGLPVAWSVETGSTHPVTVAVVDTGYDLNHPELKGRFLPGFDFCKKSEVIEVKNEDGQIESKLMCNGAVDKNPTYGNLQNFHGTHVAGLIAAAGNNNIGIAGAAFGQNIKLLPIKIFDDDGRAATVDTFVNAIRWAVGLEVQGAPLNPNPARIINLSLGGLFPSDALQDVVNEAHQRGALILAATGNDGLGTLRIPASCNNVVGVGSVEINFERSSFSNYSAKTLYGPGVVDVMTPGGSSNGGLISTYPEGYGQLHGTSMATPIAAGIAALILSQSPGLSVAELEKRLLAATYLDTDFMNTTEYGKGVLRADLALGLPGPESNVTLVLSGPTIRIMTTTLEVSGQTKAFSLESLEPGDYKLTIIANGTSAQLAKTVKVQLTENQSKILEITLP